MYGMSSVKGQRHYIQLLCWVSFALTPFSSIVPKFFRAILQGECFLIVLAFDTKEIMLLSRNDEMFWFDIC